MEHLRPVDEKHEGRRRDGHLRSEIELELRAGLRRRRVMGDDVTHQVVHLAGGKTSMSRLMDSHHRLENLVHALPCLGRDEHQRRV